MSWGRKPLRISQPHNLEGSSRSDIILGQPLRYEVVQSECEIFAECLGLHFSLISEDEPILVNHDGKVVDGGRFRFLDYAAFGTHSEIHTARLDVVCAAHSHSTFGRAFCATGRTLDPITQDSCKLYDDNVLCG